MPVLVTVAGCGSPREAAAWRSAGSPVPAVSSPRAATTPAATTPAASPSVAAPPGPAAGNPNGHATVPAEAKAVDTSKPTRVIGTGAAAGCTSEAVVSAVTAGGVITFNCGPDPVTIVMKATA